MGVVSFLSDPRGRLARAALPLLVAAAAAGCRATEGEGQVVIDGLSVAPRCTDEDPLSAETLDLGIDTFCGEPIEVEGHDFLDIRLQHGGGHYDQNDSFHFFIQDVALLAPQLVDVPVGPGQNVSARLTLRETCPDAFGVIEGFGTVTFQQLGGAERGGVDADFALAYGDRLVATFDLEMIGDGSIPGTADVRGRLRGDFDFELSHGPPCQRFP